MTQYFRRSQKDASTIYKVYTSFVYVTPISGAFWLNCIIGNRTAVIIGATLMAIGHFLMAFEEFPIFLSVIHFSFSGNGMLKPNTSTQVGRLYPPNDGRRDSAYTIFYMGINLGAFLAPLVCGWLKDNTIGEFHSGFTMAGIGMVIGLVIYLLGQPLIQELETESA
jgi:POT family proton-dependent oligopeptide transporter